MPNIRSAKKRMRQANTRRLRNRVHRATLRTAVKSVREAGSADEALRVFRDAEVALDRAARKNLIHRNKAARTKQRLLALIRKSAAN
ncbi:MAG: 30S ribosomal protein S20 [Gemmatimonadales bacterium]